MTNLSRRMLLRGAAVLAGASALPARAALPVRKALALVFLPGGFGALHCTPQSLGGTFGTTADSMTPTGTGLFVDKATFGGFSSAVLRQMAVVGVDHGLTAHSVAVSSMFTGSSSYPLALAAAMQSEGALRCALFGDMPSSAAFSSVAGASLALVRDVQPAIDIMVGSTRAGEPPRGAMARGLRLSYTLSKSMIERNPRTLAGNATGYDTLIGALEKPVRPLDWREIATRYGLDPSSTVVSSNASRFAAAELAIRGGTPVVIVPPVAGISCGEAGWDTHGDESGACVRTMFGVQLSPHLGRFLESTLAMQDTQVTTVVFGEFSRDPYLSDHARCLSAAVFGPTVKPGSTGAAFNRDGKLAMPDGTPGILQFWALLAELAGVTSKPFGANPHQLVAG